MGNVALLVLWLLGKVFVYFGCDTGYGVDQDRVVAAHFDILANCGALLLFAHPH